MKLNADLSRRAVMHSETLAWRPSPIAGVERRMLEREGDEVARATSVVRYAPGSSFSAHTHDAGEEFLVLEGVFSDETGDFPEGAYVRNPPGSRHAPSSGPGCTILVKLRQIPDDDQEYVRRSIHDSDGWRSTASSESELDLHRSRHEHVRIVRWAANTGPRELSYPGGAEYFVLAGGFEDEDGVYVRGSWLRLPAGARHAPFTAQGCTCYVKTGHLGGRPVHGSGYSTEVPAENSK
ncbi:MAG TPA: cupin domain-containing protein [Arenicellales bacterium]|nr:cupin domain-containing protein [Arenicellales bacterium]